LKINRSLVLCQLLSCRINIFRKSKGCLLSACILLLTACASGSAVPIRSIYQSQQCAIDEAQLIFLENPQQLYSFIESARHFNLTAGKAAIAAPPAVGRAIVVAFGKRPNSGYRLELTTTSARIEGDTLTLPVRFFEPGAGQMTAQIVTSPCIVIAVNTREGYRQVQAGELSAETP